MSSAQSNLNQIHLVLKRCNKEGCPPFEIDSVCATPQLAKARRHFLANKMKNGNGTPGGKLKETWDVWTEDYTFYTTKDW